MECSRPINQGLRRSSSKVRTLRRKMSTRYKRDFRHRAANAGRNTVRAVGCLTQSACRQSQKSGVRSSGWMRFESFWIWGTRIDLGHREGDSAPMRAAAAFCSPEGGREAQVIIQLLIQHGADPSARNHIGEIPLMTLRSISTPGKYARKYLIVTTHIEHNRLC